MTANAFAAFRKSGRDDLLKLEEEHVQRDLKQSDRDALKSAASKFGTHATIGSLLGLGFGLFMAFRVRNARKTMFDAFRATEKPTHVQFADGRTEPLPDLTALMQPSTLGDVATFFFFTAGGLFAGGETGLLTGSYSAGRTISRDPASQARIERAYANFKADVYQREADRLKKGGNAMNELF